LLTREQRERIEVVLVSPRNPLNIGAVARAMANFGFPRLSVVSAYEPHWREARSAVGAPGLLQEAREVASLSDAVHACTLVLGTGTLTHRKPEQPTIRLDAAPSSIAEALNQDGRIAIVFGPEKHGLTRDDLSLCHSMIEIPTDPQQPSMNLGQAAAVCLYELATRVEPHTSTEPEMTPHSGSRHTATTSGNLDVLAELIEEVMIAAKYSPKAMQAANRHDLRVMLRRLHLTAADNRRALGLFRRILWRIKHDRS
jgi:tRNA/rRNA methyltransferase